MSDLRDPPSSRGRVVRSLLLTAVIVLGAATLRSLFLAVAPVAGEIGAELEASAALVGLLTSIPVLCFAVFSPLAVALLRWGGSYFALTVTFVGAVIGCFIRVSGGIEAALLGTAIIGMFLTVGNVVMPVIIGREYRAHRVHMMTGIYTSALNVGTMTVTLATAPLANAVGWRWAVTVWAVFPLAALACWVPLRGLRAAFLPTADPRPEGARAGGSAWRNGPTLLLAAAFAGQAFAFYGITAWLPSMLTDQGYSGAVAGAIASVFQVAGIAGSLMLPVLTIRSTLMIGVTSVAIGWLTVPLGFLFAPSAWLLWCSLGGLAQGGGITIVFIMINMLAKDEHTKAGRSGTVQGVGYALAAAGPLALAALHEATGAWSAALVAVLIAVLVFLGAGLLVAHQLQGGRGVSTPRAPCDRPEAGG